MHFEKQPAPQHPAFVPRRTHSALVLGQDYCLPDVLPDVKQMAKFMGENQIQIKPISYPT